MTPGILYAGRPEQWADYQPALTRALERAGIAARLGDDLPPEEVDFIIHAPSGPLRDFSPFTRCRAVLSLWAGVEEVVDNPTLTQPLARMADEGLREGMTEWVTGQVLRHHLGLDRDILNRDCVWHEGGFAPLARERRVGILGLGALGTAAARALAGLNFQVSGWSRTPKDFPGVTCWHGESGLDRVLAQSQILVLLLPDTPATRDILNAETLGRMPRGAVVINPGRGTLIDDAALLSALDSGQVGHATLDVFRVEPLPPEHPFWAHPRVTVTPHVASATRPATAAAFIVENIARVLAGQPLLAEVRRDLGY